MRDLVEKKTELLTAHGKTAGISRARVRDHMVISFYAPCAGMQLVLEPYSCITDECLSLSRPITSSTVRLHRYAFSRVT